MFAREALRHSLKELKRFLSGMRVRAASLMRAHGGKIAYYACVAVALSAIAYAADQYRAEREVQADALILPAVELEALPTEPTQELSVPEGALCLRKYASAPEWNSELGLWESHAAVDYRLEGDAVVSLCAGTVRTVGASGVYGGFIEVESEELLLRYASVSPAEGIVPGMRVEMGERIAVADDSMPGEALMGAHLHLEMEREGRNVDFEMEAQGIQPGVD